MRFLPALLVLLAAAPVHALRLTIVHTNDVHGWIMSRPSREDEKRLAGGAAALGALYRKQPGAKVLVDAGDWFQGTPEGTVSRGEAAVNVFNALPYDFVTVGNHDYDFAEGRLKELVGMLHMPVLGANVRDAKTHERVPYLKPYVIRVFGGVRVGFFGLLTTNMRNLTFPENYEGLEFRDELAEARDTVAELKRLGCTVIVLVDHVGFEEPTMSKFVGDQTIAREVPGIDLIVGGHSHTFVKHAVRDPKNGTLITQAGAYLAAAGVTTLDIDEKTGKVEKSEDSLVDLYPDQGEDPVVKQVVADEAAKVSAIYDVVIATSEAMLTRSRDSEATLGDWMTDCERSWAGGADLGIQNAGGIRADLPKGPVTLRTIFNIMPFDNYLVKLDMDGGLVREVLDHGVDKTKGLVQVSGAAIAFDRDAADGKRLKDVKLGGRPLDDKKLYSVVTIDFLVKGGDGYSPFGRAEKLDRTRVLLRDALAQCARQQKLIQVPQGGRLKPAGRP